MGVSVKQKKIRGQMPIAFSFFAAIIVIVAVLFLGFRMIGSLSATGCDASTVTFMEEITDVLDIGTVFGSSRSETLRPPCDARMLCFVDAQSLGDEVFLSDDATITSSVRSNVQANIFLVTQKEGTIDIGYDARIILRERGSQNIPQAPLCVASGPDGFLFRTEGYGRSVRILQ